MRYCSYRPTVRRSIDPIPLSSYLDRWLGEGWCINMKRTRWLLSAAAWLVSLLACVSAQCIDNDKKLKKMMPGAPACARIAARSLCSHDTGDGTTIADLNVCQCSCPLPPPPTTCAGGGNSSGTLRPDDAQCCNVARWRDNEGATCKDYVENGWCCSASNRGCNAQSSLPSGLDSDHGCWYVCCCPRLSLV
eukprot:COSAG01_NODE_3764_length_5719_cov_9.441815_2_plen_191_part_00